MQRGWDHRRQLDGIVQSDTRGVHDREDQGGIAPEFLFGARCVMPIVLPRQPARFWICSSDC